MGVGWNLVALIVVFSHFTLADEFLKNEYVYSVERDWMLQQEKEYSDKRLALTEVRSTLIVMYSYKLNGRGEITYNRVIKMVKILVIKIRFCFYSDYKNNDPNL